MVRFLAGVRTPGGNSVWLDFQEIMVAIMVFIEGQPDAGSSCPQTPRENGTAASKKNNLIITEYLV